MPVNKNDEQIMNIIKMMQKYHRKSNAYVGDSNSKAMYSNVGDHDINSVSRISNSEIKSDVYRKRALYDNFIKVSKKLHLTNASKRVGTNFIETFFKDAAARDDKEQRIVKESINSLKGVYESIIESYTAKHRTDMNEIKGVTPMVESHISNSIADNYTKEFDDSLERLTPERINQKIADRVQDATEKFIEKTNEKNEKIKDIYDKAAAKIKKVGAGAPSDSGNDNLSNQISESAKLQISRLNNNTTMTVLESMIFGLTKAAMIDKNFHKVYTENNELNMDKIVDDTVAIYAVMETAQVYGLYDINKDFIKSYLSSLKK